MSRAIPTLLLLLSAACTVPSLEELEAERPSGCNAQHPCQQGQVCEEGRCVTPTTQSRCAPGTQQLCGPSSQGPDEDCAGPGDTGPAHEWGRSEALASGQVAALPVRRTAGGALDARLVVYEQGQTLYSRVMAQDGTLSAPHPLLGVPPTGTRHLAPALASDGALIILAYVQETATSSRLVRLASLGADGHLTSSAHPTLAMGSVPARLTLALDATHIRVLAEDWGSPGAPPALYMATVDKELSSASVSAPHEAQGLAPRCPR